MLECPRAHVTFVGRLRNGVGDIISYGLIGVQELPSLLIPLYEPTTMNLNLSSVTSFRFSHL